MWLGTQVLTFQRNVDTHLPSHKVSYPRGNQQSDRENNPNFTRKSLITDIKAICLVNITVLNKVTTTTTNMRSLGCKTLFSIHLRTDSLTNTCRISWASKGCSLMLQLVYHGLKLRNSVLLKFNDKTRMVGDELHKPSQLPKEILPSWSGALRIILQ